jgi:hypothetical protein
MEYTKPDELARVRALADDLGCLTEDDFMLLAKVTPSTAEAWRKRRQGPDYIRIGNRVLYPRAAVAKHLESLTCERPSMAKALL